MIRTGRLSPSRWLYVARGQIASISLAALLFSCMGERLTQANVNQVTEGMSKKQVESILGPPTSVESKDFMLLKRTTYLYKQDNGTVTVLFKDDKVAAKSSTLPPK
jgi:outer membrane protein assembly factor BamE (lipoprotein component of BamABCDE complex)